jgi:AraC family transcriptional activator of pobA
MYFTAPALYYILPGQVHKRIEAEKAGGWFIAIDPMLVAQDYRTVFDDQLPFQQPHIVSPQQLAQCSGTLRLLIDRYENEDGSPFYLPVVHSLLQSFLGMAASCYCLHTGPREQPLRPVQITQQFKRLLAANIRTVKSPSAYAAMLNISETYLNEALRKTSGLPVSYWIMQEVMLEAKRLLYYGDMNVKEIAHLLGYPDPTYFSKLFKKVAGTTPLAFRESYRK